jgi:hypothetical protein
VAILVRADRPRYVVSDTELGFAATLVVARRASAETDKRDRHTLVSKRFTGGLPKGGRSPRAAQLAQ